MMAVVALLKKPGIPQSTKGTLTEIPALPLLTSIQARALKLLEEGFQMRRRILVEIDDLDPPTKEDILLPLGRFCLAGRIFPASVLDDLMELGLVDTYGMVTELGEGVVPFLQKPLAEGIFDRLRKDSDAEWENS